MTGCLELAESRRGLRAAPASPSPAPGGLVISHAHPTSYWLRISAQCLISRQQAKVINLAAMPKLPPTCRNADKSDTYESSAWQDLATSLRAVAGRDSPEKAQ